MRGNNYKKIKDLCILLLAILIAAAFLSITKIGCPIKFITGISCPGCGLTRAWLAFFKGQFKLAFYYHPLFLLVPVAFILAVSNNKYVNKYKNQIILVFIVLFILVYLLRMFFGNGEIVSFHPEENIYFKIIKILRR